MLAFQVWFRTSFLRGGKMRTFKLRYIKWLLTLTYLNINLCIQPHTLTHIHIHVCTCAFILWLLLNLQSNKENKMWLFDLTTHLKYKFCRETKFQCFSYSYILSMLIQLVDFLSLCDPLRRLTSNYMLVIFLLLSRRKFKRGRKTIPFFQTLLLYGEVHTMNLVEHMKL